MGPLVCSLVPCDGGLSLRAFGAPQKSFSIGLFFSALLPSLTPPSRMFRFPFPGMQHAITCVDFLSAAEGSEVVEYVAVPRTVPFQHLFAHHKGEVP